MYILRKIRYVLMVCLVISLILVGCKSNSSHKEEMVKIDATIESYFKNYYSIDDYKILDNNDESYKKEIDLVESIKEYTTEEFYDKLKLKGGSGTVVDTAKGKKRNIKVENIEYEIKKPEDIKELKDEITLQYTADFKFYDGDKEDVLKKEGQIRLKKVNGEWKVDYEPGYIPYYMFEKIK